MDNLDFTEEFCRFLQETIPAVDAAELLLCYRGHPETAFAVEEAVAKLGPGISTGDAEKYLRLFEAQGLIGQVEGGYRYRPESELAPQVERLALAYNRRPVTLIRVIYAFRDSGIKSFAEAFRLRK
jgi:hypothetical protein